MFDVRKDLKNLIDKAKLLHQKERQITLESVVLVDELERRNAAINMGLSSEKFALFVELTPNQYWKRAQAGRVIRFFPKALEMAQAGETQVSHLALLSSKITEANADILLSGIKNKSKREVEGLLSRVTLDGQLLDKEEDFELRLKLTRTQIKVLDRAREVLSHGGHVPSLSEIFIKALGDLLAKRDPIRKAERAAIRKQKGVESPSPGKEERQSNFLDANAPSPGKEADRTLMKPFERPSPGKDGGQRRPAIPAMVRHAVWHRDSGQCTWIHPDGCRCSEKSMLELDHIKMWCRGGDHTADNLTLRCRRHNQFAAEKKLGADFMAHVRKTKRYNSSGSVDFRK